MNSQDKENVIIYRIKEKGLEVFLVNKDEQNKDNGSYHVQMEEKVRRSLQ